MSPDHQLSERVYRALKGDLLDGDLHELRLPIARLEARYHTSATPVREALLRLVGEGLVGMNPAGGFSMPSLTERQVREMYELNMQVLLAAASWPTGSETIEPNEGPASPLATSIDDLFVSIGLATDNLAVVALIDSLNDRMRRIRRTEMAILDDHEREFATIERQFRHREKAKLRRSLIAYHRRRIRNSRTITARLLLNITTGHA